MAKPRTYGFRATNPRTMGQLERHFWKKAYQQHQRQREAARRNPVAGQIVKAKGDIGGAEPC